MHQVHRGLWELAGNMPARASRMLALPESKPNASPLDFAIPRVKGSATLLVAHAGMLPACLLREINTNG